MFEIMPYWEQLSVFIKHLHLLKANRSIYFYTQKLDKKVEANYAVKLTKKRRYV